MAINPALFSSATDEWATPPIFFEQLNKEFHFTLDPCATVENAKCHLFFTRKDDGLRQSWAPHIIFCNPPYGKAVSAWIEKAYKESLLGATVVLLIPARTDTKYFHEYILGKAEIRFLRGRLKFGGSKSPAPFPSMLAIYRGRHVPAQSSIGL